MGQVYDNVGEVWEKGAGGLKTISVDSTRVVYPVWTVLGPCSNPKLQNNTTDTEATYSGVIAEGQTLKVDFAAGTAYVDNALMTRNLVGTVTLQPGDNQIGFDASGDGEIVSRLNWNNVIN